MSFHRRWTSPEPVSVKPYEIWSKANELGWHGTTSQGCYILGILGLARNRYEYILGQNADVNEAEDNRGVCEGGRNLPLIPQPLRRKPRLKGQKQRVAKWS